MVKDWTDQLTVVERLYVVSEHINLGKSERQKHSDSLKESNDLTQTSKGTAWL